MSAQLQPETHSVFARMVDGSRVRVTEPLSWESAQHSWTILDALKFNNYYPHVSHFEVRSNDDPNYKDAPSSMIAAMPVMKSRGLTEGVAAKRAWKAFQGDLTPNGAPQGTGGWYYYSNGPAAQGEGSLVKLCKRRNLIVQGPDKRWYVLDQGTLT